MSILQIDKNKTKILKKKIENGGCNKISNIFVQ